MLVKKSENNKDSLQYAIYTILSGEYTRFEEPEYSAKSKLRRYESPFEILEKLRYA